jgi:hypothetical protein
MAMEFVEKEDEIIPPLEDTPQARLLITIDEAAGLLNIGKTTFCQTVRPRAAEVAK